MSMTQALQPRRAPVVEVDREGVRDQDVSKVLETIASHGFCVVPNLITQVEAENIRAHLDALRDMEQDPKVLELGHHRVLHLVAKHPVFHGPLRHPFVLAVWRRYLGEDMVCSTYT